MALTTSATLAANLSGGDHVFIGGVVDFNELGTGSLAASLTAGGVALYMHANAMQTAYNAGELPAIAASYADAGPGEAEFGFQSGANLTSYFEGYFTRVYQGQGLLPDEANIVLPVEAPDAPAILTASELASWDTYVDAAKAAAVLSVAPIISPNTGTEDISSWNIPYWAPAQAAAAYGGGITVDTPPGYFLARGSDYEAFTEQQITWANANGLRSTMIISPYGDAGSLLADTQAVVAKLATADAMPTQFVVEDYDAGGSYDVTELAQVALWLAQNTPGAAPTAPLSPATRAVVNAAATTTGQTSTVATTAQATTIAASTIAIQAGASDWVSTPVAKATIVTLGSGAETVSAQGSDTVLAGSGAAVIYASGPAVSVAGGSGGLLFVGGAGEATVSGGSGVATLFGGVGSGTLTAGQAGSSILVAGGANTTLQGAAAGDVLFGAATANGSVLQAGSGMEILVAGAGTTTLMGGPGTSVQFAGSGTDWFMAGSGGTDEVVGFKSGDRLVIPAGQNVSATQHGAWGTTLTLSDNTEVVLFGLAVTPAV